SAPEAARPSRASPPGRPATPPSALRPGPRSTRARRLLFLAAVDSLCCPAKGQNPLHRRIPCPICRVTSKLLCFGNGKILTLAGCATAEHQWITDEDSRVPSQSNSGTLWRYHSPRGSRLLERRGARGREPPEIAGGGG